MALVDGERPRPLSAPPGKHSSSNPHKQSRGLCDRWDPRRLLIGGRNDTHARSLSSSRIGSGFGSKVGESDSFHSGRQQEQHDHHRVNSAVQRLSRKVNVGLPRATTLSREISERRDRLFPVRPEARPFATPQPTADDGQRASQLQAMVEEVSDRQHDERDDPDPVQPSEAQGIPEQQEENWNEQDKRGTAWERARDGHDVEGEGGEEMPAGESDEPSSDMELDENWILNLSMHFRDRSEREKFFVTYAETPNRWRRVTISCDYRDAPPESLEGNLRELRYQRDKSARIYDALRDSLPEIQFYDTVTNLKLETHDGRLHVHVTEDVNETIPYPPVSCARHLSGAFLVPESLLDFDAHLSGFVYKVRLGGRELVKKEIPGPDMVDEFFYEINALHCLSQASNVVRFEGIVVDDRRRFVKGLLISHARRGALADILYEEKGKILWERRERWAWQIVSGLCEIHEAGYVQGDFTPSNIVVDEHDNAKIIDINRRGCPVGFEPPEIAAKIASNQRIAMYIGVKTDIFQLGMTLWALAMQEDEVERQERPLIIDEGIKIPEYYRQLVGICLSPMPQRRLSAKELLNFFPDELMGPPRPMLHSLADSESAVVGSDGHDKFLRSVPVNTSGSLSTSTRDSLDDGQRTLDRLRYDVNRNYPMQDRTRVNPLGGNPVQGQQLQDDGHSAPAQEDEPESPASLGPNPNKPSFTSTLQEASISNFNFLSKTSLPINPATN